MSTFITRIKNEMSNYRGRPDKTTISRRDLQELISHFEAMDSALRSEYDSKIPTRNQNRYACLAHEIQAAFHNLGVEETLDIFMFTLSELRKQQLEEQE